MGASEPCKSSIFITAPTSSVSTSVTTNLMLPLVVSASCSSRTGVVFLAVFASSSLNVVCTPLPSLRSYSYVTFTTYALSESRSSKILSFVLCAVATTVPSRIISIFATFPTSSTSVSFITNLILPLVVSASCNSNEGVTFLAVLAFSSLMIDCTPLPSLRS